MKKSEINKMWRDFEAVMKHGSSLEISFSEEEQIYTARFMSIGYFRTDLVSLDYIGIMRQAIEYIQINKILTKIIEKKKLENNG